MQKQHSIISHQNNSTFFSRQHTQSNQLTRMNTTFTRFDSAKLLSLGGHARTWSMKISVNRLQISKIFRMLSETNGMMSTSDSQNQKSQAAVKKAFISNGKTELMTNSAHFLLIS